MSPVIPPPQKYSGLLQFHVVVPSCKSHSPGWSSSSSLFPFSLCKNLFPPSDVNTSDSSMLDAGNQAFLLPNPAWQPARPHLLLPATLSEELGSSFSTGRESRDVARTPEPRKNPWHTSGIRKCLAAQASAACVRKSTGAFELSDLMLWESSKGSKFHKCTGYTNRTSSKDLIRKLQFIKRSPISYFNYFFSYARIAGWRLGCISEPSTLCCSLKHLSVIEGPVLVKKLFLKKLSGNILWSFWAIRLSMPADWSPVWRKMGNPSPREVSYF